MLSWSQHYKCQQPSQGNRRDHNENDWLQTRSDELDQQYNEINKREGEEYPVEEKSWGSGVQEKEMKLKDLWKQSEITPPLMSECEHISEKLQAAERDSRNLEDEVGSLKTDIEESKYGHHLLKVEPKSFLEALRGKI